MSLSVEAVAVAKKYTDNSILGIVGALAGKNCTIKSIDKVGDTNTVTFEWTANDGTTKTSIMLVKDGERGIGIDSIDKIGTVGLVDTYQILYSDGNTQNFSVTNGKDGAERVRLVSDGVTIDLDGVPQTFVQVRDLIMDNTKLVTLNLWDNVAFLPSSYNGTAIWFDSGFIMNNTPTQMRVIINDQNDVKVDQIDLARKDEITHKIIELNTATTEQELLELLTSNDYLGYECDGFFYNADIGEYCELSGNCVAYKSSPLTTVYFGNCHIRGINGNEYYVDYYIDDENKTLWNKVEFNDYIKISTESGNVLEDKNGLYVGATGVEISKLSGNSIEMKPDGLFVQKTSDVEISKDEQNVLSKKSDGLFVPVTDLTNYVEKETGKSLVSTTDIQQITTNKNNIGNMNNLVVTSWGDLVSAINSLYNGFMQGVSYANKKLTITYRSGATFDIDLSPIIVDTPIGQLSNVSDDGITDGQALVYDNSTSKYVPHTFDLAKVLTDAKSYTDTQLAQHEKDIAIACDEKPTYNASTDTVTYKQGGVTKTESKTSSWFYYKDTDGVTNQVRWINGVEFLISVGDVDLTDYVSKTNDVKGTFAEIETELTKVPNLNYIQGLRNFLVGIIGQKINSTDIVDNLLSDDTTKVLSAKQGKELKTEVDKKVQVIRVTQAQYDQLPDDSTGKQNPSIIWRITDSGVSVNLINDEKVETTSSWSSEKINGVVGDVSSLSTQQKNNVVDAINEIKRSLTYNAGDTVSKISGQFAGVVTSSSTAIAFTVPLDKQIIASVAELIAGTVNLRHTGGFVYIAKSGGNVSVNGMSFEDLLQSFTVATTIYNHMLFITIKVKTGKLLDADGKTLTNNLMATGSLNNATFRFS